MSEKKFMTYYTIFCLLGFGSVFYLGYDTDQLDQNETESVMTESMTDFIKVEDRFPDDDTLVIGVDLGYETSFPDAAIFCFMNGEFHVYTEGLIAENFDGGASISQDMNITHWKYLF